MINHKLRVLVVATDKKWRDSYIEAFLAEGCEVKTVPDGMEALECLHKLLFDVVVADDSCCNMDPMEFMFNVKDLASNEPIIMLGGKDLDGFEFVWKHSKVFFAGPKNELLSMVSACADNARSRTGRIKSNSHIKKSDTAVDNEISEHH